MTDLFNTQLELDFTAPAPAPMNIIKTIEDLTFWNDHSQAVVLLAEHFGTSQQLTEAKRVKELHREAGSIDSYLFNRREVVKMQILVSIAQTNFDLYTQIRKAF